MNQIDITCSINISNNYKTVFTYFANCANDKHWRAEINNTTLNTDRVEKNMLVTEDSFLSRKVPNHISIFTCTELQTDSFIINETTDQNKFWSKNTRTVEPLTDNKTKVTYRIQFDMDIVKYGLGFKLPFFIVHFYTKATMKKYLSQLKKILEK